MARVKRHHYLPQFYLRPFASKPGGKQLYRIEKSEEARSYSVGIQDSGVESDFHTVDHGTHRDSESVERELSKLEGLQATTLARVLQREPLSQHDLVLISGFFSLMRLRVPSFKTFLDEKMMSIVKMGNRMLAKDDRLERTTEKHNIPIMPGASEAAKKALFDRMRDMILNDKYNVDVSNAFLLGMMFKMAFEPRILAILDRMRLTTLEAPAGCQFVTCDQPVSLFRPVQNAIDGGGLAHVDTQLSIAVSPRSTLQLDWMDGPTAFATLTADEVVEYNRRTIVMAERSIYTAVVDEGLLNLVRENCKRFAGFRTQAIETRKLDGGFVMSDFAPVVLPESNSSKVGQ